MPPRFFRHAAATDCAVLDPRADFVARRLPPLRRHDGRRHEARRFTVPDHRSRGEIARARHRRVQASAAPKPENTGLYRFKTGFNAAVRTLEAAVFSGVGTFQRKLRSLLQLAVTNPRAIPAAFGGVESYVVYRADPRNVAVAPLPADIAVGKLTDEELRGVADDTEIGFSARKLNVLRNTAYGVRVGGERRASAG